MREPFFNPGVWLGLTLVILVVASVALFLR